MSEEAPEYPEHQPPGIEPPVELPTEEMDLTTPTDPTPAPEPPPEAQPAPQAEPGVYLCTAEIAGEHARLGVLTEGEQYDYSHADPLTLQAVAAYVELGALEKM